MSLKSSVKQKLRHRIRFNSIFQYPNHLNTSERNRGMDIHQLKQRIDASGKKLVTLGNEYIKSKDEIAFTKGAGEDVCWHGKTVRIV